MELKKTAEGLKKSFADEENPLNDIRPDLEEAAKTFKGHVLDLQAKGIAATVPLLDGSGDSAANAHAELAETGIDTTAIVDLDPADMQEAAVIPTPLIPAAMPDSAGAPPPTAKQADPSSQ